MSLPDVVLPPAEQALPYSDEISSAFSAQFFELIDPDLFPEPLRNWEVAYSNKCFYEDNSYAENLLFTSEVDDKFSIEPIDINKFQDDQNEANTATTTTPTTSNIPTIVETTTISACPSTVSDFQNEIYDDTSSYTDFSPSSFSGPPYLTTSQQYQIDYTRQVPVTIDGFPQFTADAFAPLMALPLPPFLEEDCLYPVPPSLGLNPCAAASCSFMDPSMGSFYPGDLNVALASESRGLFDRTISAGQELQQKQRDYQRDTPGIFCTDQPPGITNDGCIQELCNESQPTKISEAACSIPSTTETLNLEYSTFKVVKLSTAERKEKIDRYLKKRNERNFSKKIKYACRKTLAGGQRRVRGRFAKNCDCGGIHCHIGGQHEEDDYDEVTVEEEDLMDSSDIFSHISGVNSFQLGYTIHSWM